MEHLAESNRDLAARVAATGATRYSAINGHTTALAAPSPPKRPPSSISEVNITPWMRFSFDKAVHMTRVYSRAARNSLPGKRSALCSHFSGLSMAQVADLSAISLPLRLEDVTNRHNYDVHADPSVPVPAPDSVVLHLPASILPSPKIHQAPRPMSPQRRPSPLLLRPPLTPPYTPRSPTQPDSPLPPIPTTPLESLSLPTTLAITRTLLAYVALRELVAPTKAWENGTNFRHQVAQFSLEMLEAFALDVHDELLRRRRGVGVSEGAQRGRLARLSDTAVEHLGADVVWEVRRRFSLEDGIKLDSGETVGARSLRTVETPPLTPSSPRSPRGVQGRSMLGGGGWGVKEV